MEYEPEVISSIRKDLTIVSEVPSSAGTKLILHDVVSDLKDYMFLPKLLVLKINNNV